MKIVMCVALSLDAKIADSNGNGDFSSIEDKKQFREFLHSNEVDAFIAGRKTADEFRDRLCYKPLYTFTNSCVGKYCFNDYKMLPDLNFALLGGAKTYKYFLSKKLVDEVRLTVEKNILFGDGLSFDFALYQKDFEVVKETALSGKTVLIIYKKVGNCL
ncbi:MAG: dihydrofolate reductase family protein [Alphaproteobacteria bacterium]